MPKSAAEVKEYRHQQYLKHRSSAKNHEAYLKKKAKGPIKYKPKTKEQTAKIMARSHKKPKIRFSTAKRNALKRSIEWLLTYEEFVSFIGLPCVYCENKLGTLVQSGIGLDRIDSDKGYCIGNVSPCCGICNMIKSWVLSPGETRAAVQAIIKYREENNIVGHLDYVFFMNKAKRKKLVNEVVKSQMDQYSVVVDQ
jgi:hypothetical protein